MLNIIEIGGTELIKLILQILFILFTGILFILLSFSLNKLIHLIFHFNLLLTDILPLDRRHIALLMLLLLLLVLLPLLIRPFSMSLPGTFNLSTSINTPNFLAFSLHNFTDTFIRNLLLFGFLD